MAGYVLHIIHAYETYMALDAETRTQMPDDALKKMILGAISPDLVDAWRKDVNTNKIVQTVDKERTHFSIDHPVYGSSYKIPDIKMVEEHFLKKDPTRLGILSHLRYDLDYIEQILLVYFKPIEGNMYLNTKSGEKISGIVLWGNKEENVSGQLYQLYDFFNTELTKLYTNRIAAVFGKKFPESKEGFLQLMNWMFGGVVPMTGVEEIDKYRGKKKNLFTEFESYFKNDGSNCTIKASLDEFLDVVKISAKGLAKQIDALYVE